MAILSKKYNLCYDTDRIDTAPVVIINTCGFIGDAKEESINMILQCIQAKQYGYIDKVYVMGCLSQRYHSDLLSEIPEVDEFFGVNDTGKILDIMGVVPSDSPVTERLITTPKHYAYLKIAEGCNRDCAFCAIPDIRGKYISESSDRLVCEAKALVSQGVKEILVVAQDLTRYGYDINGKSGLAGLVENLSEIDGLSWIKLHYTYPVGFPYDILPLMKDNPKVCRYLDIPFQHISNSVLKKMRRGIDKSKTMALIDRIRSEVPGIALRTTLMTGFPGETEADFAELMDFVKEVRFDRLGVFAYSHEENTWAANNYKDDIPEKVKSDRAGVIMSLQEEISLELNTACIGKECMVIADRLEGNYWSTRSEFDSPEVDQEILINAASVPEVRSGDMFPVRITAAGSFDTTGVPVKTII